MDNNGEYNTQNDVNDIIDIVMKEIKESTEYTQMGTGIDEGMTRFQIKSLKEELRNILNVLHSFNKEMHDTMSKKDLYDFYQKHKEIYNWPEFEFNDDYVDSVLTILNHNNEYSISVKELIIQTLLLEEKLKIKKAKLTQDYQSINPKIAEIQDQIKKHQSLSLPIHLGVTIFEASNIEGSDIKEYYIKMNIENQTKTSSMAKFNGGMPIWNENHLITLKNRNQNLYLELYTKSFKTELLGTLNIILEELDIEQQPVEQTFTLINPNRNDQSVGELRLKLHYVYNRVKYFEGILQKVKIQKTKTEDYLKILQPFDDYYKSPFGIIMSDQIKMILDFNRKTIFQKTNDLDMFSPNLRQSAIRATYYDMQKNTTSIFDQIKKPELSTISLICICSSLFLSYWCMFTKPDMINFIFVIWALFQYKISQLISGAMFYVGLSGLAASEVIDLIALISTYKSCWLELNKETPSGLYFIAYIFTAINILIKGQIIYAVWKSKQKRNLLPQSV